MPDAIDGFFSAWGEENPERRAQIVRDSLSPEFTYLDPQSPDAICDVDAMIEYIASFTKMMPGATASVVASSQTKGHFRATVAFGMPDGGAQHGQYFATLDDDGRVNHLVGFAGMGEPA